MKDLGIVVVCLVVVMLVVFSCNSTLCDQKGGTLALSFLNKTGYACVDSTGREIAIP